MNKYFLIIVVFISTDVVQCQINNSVQFEEDSIKLKEAIESDIELKNLIQSFGDPYILLEQFIYESKVSEDEFLEQESALGILPNVGETQKLRIIPIVEWFTLNDEFLSIDGVSYLIQVDSANILFDLGSYNQQQSENAKYSFVDTKDIPAPLPHNFKKAGYSFSEIDYIVMSHDHYDHTGGNGETINTNTFFLDREQFYLGNINVFTPVKMEYPGSELIHSVNPIKICEGVTTTGVISNYDFFVGELQEQALVINVKDHGIVLILGCGHQTIPKLLRRTKTCFSEPLYGLIGGLHLVCSNSRNLGMLKFVGAGRPPWSPMNKKIIKDYISELELNDIQMIGLSGHDSCDSTLFLFKSAFGERYKDVIAGKPIDIRRDNN